MANVQALGGGPISFADASGKQFAIPLVFVTFAAGTASAAAWPGHAAEQATVDGWLANLVGQGLLGGSPLPANPPALTIVARDPGAAGNDISVMFANIVPNATAPSQSTMDVTVSTSQPYSGLSLANIATVLGSTAGGGTKPGLAFVDPVSISADLPTVTAAAENFSGSPAALAVASASGTAFKLLATHDGADAALLSASISAVDGGAGTFELTLAWSKAVTGVTLAALGSTFDYLLTVTPPQGGFANVPAAGTVTLLGGTDPSTTTATAPATAAQAIAVAG